MGDEQYANADLDRLMEQDGRRLLEARMLPDKGSLTAPQREEVRKALEAYLAKYDISQKDVARQVADVGYQAISGILKASYTHGTLDDHLRALNDWMEVDARRRQAKSHTRFVETRVAKRLMNAAQRAAMHTTILLAHGPTGIGKSMVAHVVTEKLPGTIYIRVSAGNASFTGVRRMLATRLRLSGGRPRSRQDSPALTLDERIFDKLRNTHRLIVVDEAHRISDGAMEFLRDVYDECNVPILLLCTKDLLDRVRKDSDEDHGQLYSRIRVCDLTRGFDKVPGGKNPLFTIGEIRKLFESDKVRLAPDAQGFLQDVANMLGQGSLRLCCDIMAWAVDIERVVQNLSARDVITLTEPLLRKTEQEMKQDRSMLADMEARCLPAARAAAS